MMEKIKSVIGNGLLYGVVLFALSILIGYLFHVNVRSSLWMASLLGISALFLNGSIYGRFAKPTKNLESIPISLHEKESLLVQAPANHMVNDSLVPGKLILTDKRIIFKSYASDEKDSREFFVEFEWN